MTVQPTRILVLCVGLTLAAGCKNDEACTKARHQATDVWKTIYETAGKNKVAPTMGIDELPADKTGHHVETWGTIEKYADMIASAFAYAKITWNTANPAQQKANAAWDAYFAKESFRTFDTQLRDANDKFRAVADACAD